MTLKLLLALIAVLLIAWIAISGIVLFEIQETKKEHEHRSQGIEKYPDELLGERLQDWQSD